MSLVQQEIGRDMALEAGSEEKGRLPEGPKFRKSFRYEIEDGTISLVSDWPNLDALIEGRKPYKMTWLTQQSGVRVVPMKGDTPDQTVVFRVTPKFKFNAWKHPGIRPHQFLDRAFRKFEPLALRMVDAALMQELRRLPLV